MYVCMCVRVCIYSSPVGTLIRHRHHYRHWLILRYGCQKSCGGDEKRTTGVWTWKSNASGSCRGTTVLPPPPPSHSNSLSTLSIYYLVYYIYIYIPTYKRIPHFSGDGTTTAASAAAAVESQALHSYINVYIIDASKPPPTESSRQCVGGARRVVFGGGMFVCGPHSRTEHRNRLMVYVYLETSI